MIRPPQLCRRPARHGHEYGLLQEHIQPTTHGVSSVIPGWSEGPDLRCAIAHRGISRFRVRVFDAPRNDEVYLRNARDHFGCAAAVAVAGFFRLLMMIVISGTISRGRTPLSGWWIAPDTCDCSARASSCSASTEEPWISRVRV